MYAGRKRKRPAKRLQSKPSQSETKSNPSKRHRDRLNGELEKLANLLPFSQDVISKLDKLSILRLSVSFMRNKRYFETVLNHGENEALVPAENVKAEKKKKNPLSNNNESDLALEALGGFLLVVAIDGSIFYSSSTITDYLGFHQSDVMNQSVYEIIHTEDRSNFQQQLMRRQPKDGCCNANLKLLNGGVSQQSEQGAKLCEDRNFVARFRCLLDNSSGFLSLHFTGKLKPLSNRKNVESEGGDVSQLALFSVACPLQSPSPLLEVHMRNLIFRTKHNLDFTPLSVDQKGIDVLGYTEVELTSQTGYHYIHHDDLMYTRNQHETLMKKGETGFIYLRILTKKGQWLWVQSKARLIYKNNRPDYMVCTHRPMSDEEGKQHLSQRNNPYKFPLSSKEAIMYECNKNTLSPYPGIMRMSVPNEMPAPKRSRSKKRPKLGDLRNMGPLHLPNNSKHGRSNSLYSGLQSKNNINTEQQYSKSGVQHYSKNGGSPTQQYPHTNGLPKRTRGHSSKSWMEVIKGSEVTTDKNPGCLFDGKGVEESAIALLMGSSSSYGNGYIYNSLMSEQGPTPELYARCGSKYQEGYMATVDDGCLCPEDMVLNGGHGYGGQTSYINASNGLCPTQGGQEFGQEVTTSEGPSAVPQFVFETAVSVGHPLTSSSQLLYHSPADQAYVGPATGCNLVTPGDLVTHGDLVTSSSDLVTQAATYDSDQASSSYQAP